MTAKKITLIVLMIVGLIFFSYYNIDRELVWVLVSQQSRNLFFLKIFANEITNFITVFIFLFYIYLAIKFTKFTITINNKKLMYMCNSVVIATYLKDGLKIIFGRYWTTSYMCNIPSLLDTHLYGFNWFSKDMPFSSFPSGHTTIAFSFSTSMWFLYPKMRTLWGILAALVAIGQVGMYYHFLSDVLTGALLGSTVAILNYQYYTKALR